MLRFHFQLLMQVRLCLGWEGEGTIQGINFLTDNGSDLLTLFYAGYQEYEVGMKKLMLELRAEMWRDC